jgi:phosphatidylglycerol:prolipoprotein diacylglycerol transferase
MYPELFHIGPITIRAYGLMLAVSFFLGVLYVYRTARRDRKAFEPFLAMAYIMIFGGIFGARLSYVLLHLEEFAGDWAASFNPFGSDQFGIAGLNMYGGILLAIAGSIVYGRWRKLSVLDMFDYFAPTVGLGLALARIGCFFNGCCFGTPTDLPWGVAFPAGSIPYSVYFDTHLHPSQLYSSLYGLGLFVLLHFVLKRRRFVGQVLALMFMIEAVFRFAIEYVRFYEEEMILHLGGVQPTYNQIISVALFFTGLVIYVVQSRKPAQTTEA